jgi:putative oxidoreductase
MEVADMPNLEKVQLTVLSLFRAVVGLLFMCHGLASIFGVLGGAEGTHGSLVAGSWPGWWAALIQLVCGALVLVGLATRPAAVLGSGSMAYAYFTVHVKVALFPIQNGGEPAVMFCWSLLLIALFGPGPWALDGLLSRVLRRNRSQDASVDALVEEEPVPVAA